MERIYERITSDNSGFVSFRVMCRPEGGRNRTLRFYSGSPLVDPENLRNAQKPALRQAANR